MLNCCAALLCAIKMLLSVCLEDQGLPLLMSEKHNCEEVNCPVERSPEKG